MDQSLILKNIAKHISLTASEKEYFSSLLEFKKINARQFLLRSGEICKHSSFVTVGCLRAFTVDKNGVEHILSFAPQEWWVGDMYSLLSQKPGNLNVEAMTDTEVLMLSKKDQEKLYEKVPKFERFFRIIIEKSLVAYQQRLIDNLSLTAQERYLKFCTTYPAIINTIPQKQVAAYIGVTPEFLSKLKAKYLKAH
ncbi:MAG: Crp/Fnr family transcriptional regulator [Bacteroidia bacterium]|nr:Crp/Fnr family transcriptional regulator [Bacteroidia bacterium]